jgi:hypothetical protein
LVDWLNSGDAPEKTQNATTATSTTTAATPANVMPTPAMWKKYIELETEAHTLHIETASMSIDSSVDELVAAGRSLRAKVNAAKAKASQEQAQAQDDDDLAHEGGAA